MVLFENTQLPGNLGFYLDRVRHILKEKPLQKLAETNGDDLGKQENIYYAFHLRNHYKTDTLELIDIFSRLEAWYSMAMAVKKFNLVFPEFIESDEPYLEVKGLFHVILPNPVAYDLSLKAGQNFLFLTGANMAGKSTFIKAVGTAVFMAHLGMGVPAQEMHLSLFDGILSNINVVDNIVKGESYFFNEVQRIKNYCPCSSPHHKPQAWAIKYDTVVWHQCKVTTDPA